MIRIYKRSKKNIVSSREKKTFKLVYGKKVLHLGCANQPFTKESINSNTLFFDKIEKYASFQYGVDIDGEGVRIMKDSGRANVSVLDVHDENNVQDFLKLMSTINNSFDFILAGEIIEHLPNPGLFIDNLKKIMSSTNSKLIITTVNGFYSMRFFWGLLTGVEAVHPDHVAYYSMKTLSRLLELKGLQILEFSYYSISDDYKNTLWSGGIKGKLQYFIDRFSTAFLPNMLSDGIVVVCQLKR